MGDGQDEEYASSDEGEHYSSKLPANLDWHANLDNFRELLNPSKFVLNSEERRQICATFPRPAGMARDVPEIPKGEVKQEAVLRMDKLLTEIGRRSLSACSVLASILNAHYHGVITSDQVVELLLEATMLSADVVNLTSVVRKREVWRASYSLDNNTLDKLAPLRPNKRDLLTDDTDLEVLERQAKLLRATKDIKATMAPKPKPQANFKARRANFRFPNKRFVNNNFQGNQGSCITSFHLIHLLYIMVRAL